MDGLKVVVKFAQDTEADVFYVIESSVPGLHVEADSFEEMIEVLKECIPELLIANGMLSKRRRLHSVPMELVVAQQLDLATASC